MINKIKFIQNKELITLITVLVFSYLLRIIYPSIFMTGGDYPGHVMASMRLHLTSLFNFDLMHNFFAQILQFNHGYTTMALPFLLYELFFNYLSIGINEISLVFINNIIGIGSLIAIFFFVKAHFGYKVSILTTVFIALTPIHIGLSRVHIGTQMIQSIFFFLSLIFLKNTIDFPNKYKIKLLYFISTFLLIGADNSFFVALFLHLVYFIIYSDKENYKELFEAGKKVYFNILSIIFIIAPLIIYMAVSFISYKRHLASGFLLRTFSKTASFSFEPVTIALWTFVLFGPIVVLFLLSLFKLKENIKDKNSLFLLIMFAIYFLILSISASSVEKNYVFFILVPVIVLSILFIENNKYWKYIVSLFLILTLLYSLSVVYGLDLGFNTTKNFGSVNNDKVLNHDYGIKALGYLIRSNEFNLSKENVNKYGINFTREGVYINYEGAYYYTGVLPQKSLNDLTRFERFILVYSPILEGEHNETVDKFVIDKNLSIYGYVINSKKEIHLIIYSNFFNEKPRYFEKERLNKDFDKKYFKMEDLVNIELGHY